MSKKKPRSESARILVIGELNVDLVASGLVQPPTLGQEVLAADFSITLGSASAIFASGIAKLGHPVTFVSKVGRDEFGTFCLEALEKSGVSVRWAEQNKKTKTGVTISLSTRRDRALVTCLGAIAELRYADVPRAAWNGHAHLHLTSYFLQHKLRPAFPQLLAEAQAKGMTTSFDPNSDPSQKWGKEIWKVIERTDMLFVNEVEALALTRKKEVNRALEKLAGTVRCVVVKLGARGAVALREGEFCARPAHSIRVVDTTGAGDSFAAGFVHGYTEGHSLAECLDFGNACGAMCAMAAGGTTGQPTMHQLKQFLQSSGTSIKEGRKIRRAPQGSGEQRL